MGMRETAGPTIFDGLRVLELTGVTGQLCGKLFADMGADVIRVEPREGSLARKVGPFADDDPGPNRNLSFWHNNTSKRSVTLNITTESGSALFRRLARECDVVIEDQPPGTLTGLGLGYDALKAERGDLVMASITPFGQTGPYRDLKTSDLVSLALGGPLWSCGYDDHDLPPVRPYTDASYHIASHYAFVGALAALVQRQRTGLGQYIDVSVHEACHDTTEGAMPNYYFAGNLVRRQTGRHAAAVQTLPVIFDCADSRAIFTRVPVEPDAWEALLDWLEEAGMVADLRDERFNDRAQRQRELGYISDIVAAFCATRTSDEIFHGAQARGMVWAPVRSPDENVHDEHLRDRGFFVEVEHPELGRTVEYAGAPYVFSKTPWRIQRRPPLLGEHNHEVYGELLGLSRDEVVALYEAGVI